MKKIKNVDALSLVQFHSVLFGLVGLLMGILYSFGGLFYDLATIGLNAGTALAFLALIGMPLLFAAVGFLLGIIQALLYNLFARWIGTIDVQFSYRKK